MHHLLIIVPTGYSPGIDFNAQTGVLNISGYSFINNPIAFYQPILDWLQDYEKRACDRTEVNINLSYVDTSSSKCLYEIFVLIKRISDRGKTVVVNWKYKSGDADMKEMGEDQQALNDLKFNFIELGK